MSVDKKEFVKQRVDVEDSGRTRTWKSDPSGPPTGRGSLFLVGRPGSGRAELGQALAQRLGLCFKAVDNADDLPGQEDGPAVCVVAPEVFDRAAETLMDLGLVAYVMEYPDPLYLSHAHFVLPAGRGLEENLEDLAEKLALTGFGSGVGSR